MNLSIIYGRPKDIVNLLRKHYANAQLGANHLHQWQHIDCEASNLLTKTHTKELKSLQKLAEKMDLKTFSYHYYFAGDLHLSFLL